ncbi:MAG: DUF512 domain-containing protein [Eubacteriaceae bacterium]|nr:DUF512 domain-containing protein [Eubacteriaceae bacterium]
MGYLIEEVESGSLAESAGLKAGFSVLALNGKAEFDILDYLDASGSKLVSIQAEDNGRVFEVTLENDFSAPVGIVFGSPTVDQVRACSNNCQFCFIAQLPKGLREGLYFKDDDYRLSFIQGNYVTLTNASSPDLRRIIDLGLSPVNVSVHCIDPQIRSLLMGNKNAGLIASQIDELASAGIMLNIQLVLCHGINDGEILHSTLDWMLGRIDSIESLSCVPVRLGQPTGDLGMGARFSAAGAMAVIEAINKYRALAKEKNSRGVFCASDEFYIIAGEDFPQDSYYEAYSQYENGVGMARSFIDDFEFCLENLAAPMPQAYAHVATGAFGASFMPDLFSKLWKASSNKVKFETVCVQNDFFGNDVGASGLMCLDDILKATRAARNINELVIPSNTLNADGFFLDGPSFGDALSIFCRMGIRLWRASNAEELFKIARKISG